MGGKCSPSGGINSVEMRSFGNKGLPNSRIDLYDEHGDLITSRWFGPDRWAIWDRHYKHGDSHKNHEFPHDHKWEWRWNRKKGEYVLEPNKSQPPSPDYC